jgi:hypothetical protein
VPHRRPRPALSLLCGATHRQLQGQGSRKPVRKEGAMFYNVLTLIILGSIAGWLLDALAD